MVTPPLRPSGQGGTARWAEGKGLSSSVSPPEVRVGESSVLWALAGLPLCGLAQLWPPPAGSPWSTVLEHPNQSLLTGPASCSHSALS